MDRPWHDRPFKQAPEFRPLRHDAYAALYEAILLGHIPPGERLVEAEIARQMGISRGPLREAIRQLEQDGLVEYRPRRGAVVAELTRERVLDAYSTRVELEGFAARLAAQRMTAADAARLAALCDVMQRCAGDGDCGRPSCKSTSSFIRRSVRFPATVSSSASGRASARTPGPCSAAPSSEAMGCPPSPSAIVTSWPALQSGDAARAEQAAREHTLEIMRDVVDHRYPGTAPVAGNGLTNPPAGKRG